MTDYLSLLSDIPSRHAGLVFEQISRAAIVGTWFLRSYGLSLPGDNRVPTHGHVRTYLEHLVNGALESYFNTKNQAPKNTAANEIWGEDGDKLFNVVVSGISEDDTDGFTAEIDMNLLYTGSDVLK